MATVFYISHPQVRVDPAVPVSDWGLSEVGRARLAALAGGTVFAVDSMMPGIGEPA
jgi:hypothetical protein